MCTTHTIGITSLPNEILIKIITLVPIDDNVTAIGLSCKALAALVLQSIYFARIHIRIQLNIAETALISQYLQDRAVKDKRWCAFPVPYKLAMYELLLMDSVLRSLGSTQVLPRYYPDPGVGGTWVPLFLNGYNQKYIGTTQIP
ncbi:hypothetical protein BCR33DRAFT_790103 [Rhizoclosmatium globosum]|uniref:F-box domain-containing protein n=1 Tax=Rhizoclosmatium globosum TaxID=329046 RepID=A0A1Y2BPH5_9FUNG|nr:hypothetical protein BCR33DRAFT_790103 [Rhizoclosmatium globosum]|eukprot:ORY36636.1 hypothetical protein BCR33DRAFT_790103 [Rhizoclosmatium globosum]